MTGAEILAIVSATIGALPTLAKGVSAAVDSFREHRQTLLEIQPGTSTWHATIAKQRAELARREAAEKGGPT